MGWIEDHYNMDEYGNFVNQEEAEKAVNNGDLRKLSNDNYYDPYGRQEYWFDGEKKD